jgi:hypothetical protein
MVSTAGGNASEVSSMANLAARVPRGHPLAPVVILIIQWVSHLWRGIDTMEISIGSSSPSSSPTWPGDEGDDGYTGPWTGVDDLSERHQCLRDPPANQGKGTGAGLHTLGCIEAKGGGAMEGPTPTSPPTRWLFSGTGSVMRSSHQRCHAQRSIQGQGRRLPHRQRRPTPISW